MPDVAQAMANFDAITYAKGQSVLKQLSAFVGDDDFVRGLQSYFRDHAWGNTRLDDLIGAVSAASGRDLTAWTTAWLDRSGTDTIRLVDGALAVTGPDGAEPRPHRLDVSSFAVRDDALDARRDHAGRDQSARTPTWSCPRPTSTCSTPAISPSRPSGPAPPR